MDKTLSMRVAPEVTSTFQVAVPDGAVPGATLALTAPNGVPIQITVPTNAPPGTILSVPMPASTPVAVAEVVAAAAPPVAANILTMENVGSAAATGTTYGIGSRTTFEIERDMTHLGGGVLEALTGIDVPNRYVFRDWSPGVTEVGWIKGEHQFGSIGPNFLEMKERRNNFRIASSLPVIGSFVSMVGCFWQPSVVHDISHMDGSPVVTTVTERQICPPVHCCLPFLRPQTIFYDVTQSGPTTTQMQDAASGKVTTVFREEGQGIKMGSHFTPCFLDCCFHPCKYMLVHVRDGNDVMRYRLVYDCCQPSSFGPLACCYEMRFSLYQRDSIEDDGKGCCNGFTKLKNKDRENKVGTMAPKMNTLIQRLLESQVGFSKRRARMRIPDVAEQEKMLLLPLIFAAMSAEAQNNETGGGGAPQTMEMER